MANKSLGSSTGVEAFMPNGDGKTPLQQALEIPQRQPGTGVDALSARAALKTARRSPLTAS